VAQLKTGQDAAADSAEDSVADSASSKPDPASPDADPPADATVPRRRPSRWAMLVVALSALLVALLVAAAVLLVHNNGVSQRAEQRQAVVETARKVVTDLNTVRLQDVEQHLDGLLQQATGPFRQQLVDTAPIFRTGVAQAELESTGAVTAVGVQSLGSDTATALVTVTTAIVDNEAPQGRLQSAGLAVQLQRDGDRWLVSAVEQLS